MVLEFLLLQLGKDKLTGFCRRAVLFPAAAAFSLDCQRGLQLISSCRFLRRKGLGKNKLCSGASMSVNTNRPMIGAFLIELKRLIFKASSWFNVQNKEAVMAEEQMVSVSTHKRQDEVITDKRVFLQRAAAALGVVVAAGLTGAAITKSVGKVSGVNARARSTEEDLRQQQIMAGKKLVIMTEKEKQQMLDHILRNHHQTMS
jgi:hypothetical protein